MVQVFVQYSLEVSVRAVAKHAAPVGIGRAIELVQKQDAVEAVEQAPQPGCERGGRFPQADIGDCVAWTEHPLKRAVGNVSWRVGSDHREYLEEFVPVVGGWLRRAADGLDREPDMCVQPSGALGSLMPVGTGCFLAG